MGLEDRLLEKYDNNYSLEDLSTAEYQEWSKRLIVILGPSGSGKTSLCQELIHQHPGKFYLLGSTISYLRPEQEVRANNYKYVDQNEFEKKIRDLSFILWNQTKEGYYGLEKYRIREALSKSDYVLVIFRALSGILLKFLLPDLLVIQLSSSPEVLQQFLKLRERSFKRNYNKSEKAIQQDLDLNDYYYDQWLSIQGKAWYRFQNMDFCPPISQSIVDKVRGAIFQ